jgi:alkanesulfonate monooxygenase SsuD/methylene tetrahydromethanopterin reductase-like flavin-dependent oxidoreductase (luciferase family)
MQFGINIPNFGPCGDSRFLAELAHDAEQAGWDGFFIWDHITREDAPPLVDPWIALAAIAMHTKRIRIGALVTPMPRRRPWMVARQAAALDHLSGGRMVLGVGSGHRHVEFGDLGEESDAKRRGEMLDEGLDILAGLWRGEPFSFEGKHYTLQNAHFLPPPLQQPRIPVWVAGFWPNKRPFRRAARWDGVFAIPREQDPGPGPPIDFIYQVRNYIQSHRQSDTPFDVLVHGATPGDDPDRAAEIITPYAEAGVTWWQERIHWEREDYPPSAYDSPREALRARILQGPPAIN